DLAARGREAPRDEKRPARRRGGLHAHAFHRERGPAELLHVDVEGREAAREERLHGAVRHEDAALGQAERLYREVAGGPDRLNGGRAGWSGLRRGGRRVRLARRRRRERREDEPLRRARELYVGLGETHGSGGSGSVSSVSEPAKPGRPTRSPPSAVSDPSPSRSASLTGAGSSPSPLSPRASSSTPTSVGASPASTRARPSVTRSEATDHR